MSINRPNSSRRLPPHIYRRRRIAGLIVLAVLVWLLWSVFAGIANLLGGSSAPAANPTASAPVQATGQACAPGSVKVTAHVGTSDGTTSVEKSSFTPAETPYMWFTLVNTSAEACDFTLVQQNSGFEITSGPDQIWLTADCADFGTSKDETVSLPAGTPITSEPKPWAKVRSSQETGCEATGNVAALPGAYNIVATVSNNHSDPVQFLIN
jgi:hypothetical protein